MGDQAAASHSAVPAALLERLRVRRPRRWPTALPLLMEGCEVWGGVSHLSLLPFVPWAWASLQGSLKGMRPLPVMWLMGAEHRISGVGGGA